MMRRNVKMGNGGAKVPSAIISLAIIILSYVLMRHIIQPPFPIALTNFYMIFVLAGVFIYITLDDGRIGEFLDFISLRSKENVIYDLIRKALLVFIPLFVAYHVYSTEKASYSPPAELFQPHVTPPQWVVDMKIPSWAADYEKWEKERIKRGQRIYENHCLSCHGKEADGKGPVASAIRYPAPPTNFKEPGTIAQLPINYVFWRVRDGGIFNKQFKSAMPGWGDELDEEEIWEVIMYIYTKAGVRPRTWE
jgi:mono/diheme cytochrome c family protein